MVISIMPATPIRMKLSEKARSRVRSLLIPISPATSRFWTTARIARPVQVLLRKSWKLTRITPAMTKQASWMMPTLIFGVK